MSKLQIKKQLRRLYMNTGIGYFRIAGASWVALLALRGFSILEIGLLESIFHIASMCFEIPSGVFADVYGRKRTMVISQCMTILYGFIMIWSNSFWSVSIAMVICALSYNLASGTREALAYDSLKLAGIEDQYDHYSSTDMFIYRITNSTATLCAGFALWLGNEKAYLIDSIVGIITLIITCGLTEVSTTNKYHKEPLKKQFQDVILGSIHFLISSRKARALIVFNAFLGSIATLILFFLQAKLPIVGLPDILFGPALFFMGLGAALGAKVITHFMEKKYTSIVIISTIGILVSFATMLQQNPYILCIGGFIGAFSDDFLQVRTDVVLNDMIPSEQRATLISVNSFTFSVIMIIMSPLMGLFFS